MGAMITRLDCCTDQPTGWRRRRLMACMVSEIYRLFKRTRLESAVLPASSSMGTAVSFLQVPPRDVIVNSPAPSAEVRNKWSCTSMPWERGFTFTSSQTVHWLTIPLFRRLPVQISAIGPWNTIQITLVSLSCPMKCRNSTLKKIRTASFHIPTSSLLYNPTPQMKPHATKQKPTKSLKAVHICKTWRHNSARSWQCRFCWDVSVSLGQLLPTFR